MCVRVCVCVSVRPSVRLSVNRFSREPCLLWAPNVTSTMGALYSKKLERRWQHCLFHGVCILEIEIASRQFYTPCRDNSKQFREAVVAVEAYGVTCR